MENQNTRQAPPPSGMGLAIKHMLRQENVQARFKEILGEKAQGFISSVLNTVQGNKALSSCDAGSIIASAAVAATLDLPVDKNLGFAWIVPYGGIAQFQMGYKGFVQLAMRTGQYRNINVIEIYEGELVKMNRLTGVIELDEAKKKSDKIVGYAAYMETVNGFQKTVYWSIEMVQKHAMRYSKAFHKKDGPWTTNFDRMAMKTVLKDMLSHWGILSIDMQKAMRVDQGAVLKLGTDNDINAAEIIYPDNNDSVPAAEDGEFKDAATAPAKRGRKPKVTTEGTQDQADDVAPWNEENSPAGEPTAGAIPSTAETTTQPAPQPEEQGPSVEQLRQEYKRTKLKMQAALGDKVAFPLIGRIFEAIGKDLTAMTADEIISVIVEMQREIEKGGRK